MRIITHESALAFLARVEPAFAPHEREHHLLLGIANALPPATYLTVESEDAVLAAAILSPDRPLILSLGPSSCTEALDALAEWLPTQGHRPRGFIADVSHAEHFATVWSRLHGDEPRLTMRQRLHALTAVSPVPRVHGQLLQAGAEDVALLTRWQAEFNREALGGALDPEMRDTLIQRVEEGEIFLWVDGEPRSMAAWARPTRRGVAINSVYTPPQWRGRGYATACVSALSRRLLEGGKSFCVLYTDLANPTSNAIYARMGYEPVADSLVYRMEGPRRES